MASLPQIPDPEPRRPNHEDAQPGNRTSERRARRARNLFWTFWIVVAVCVVGWLVWGASNGGHIPFTGQSSVQSPPVSGSGLTALNAADKQPFAGKSFQLNNVPVQTKINSKVFWIGRNKGTSMLMVMNKPNTAKNGLISEGQLVDVTGTVEKAPPAGQARQQWSLSSGDAARLQQQGAYIQATQAFWVPR